MKKLNKKFKFCNRDSLVENFECYSNRTKIGILLLSIILITLYFSNQIELHSFFMDDLVYWNVYKQNNLISFIFNNYANKFRPVANIVQGIGLFIIGDNLSRAEYVINFFSCFVVSSIFLSFFKKSNNLSLSFSLSLLFVISRFAYYVSGQYYGLMENLGLLLCFVFIYRFTNAIERGFTLKDTLISSLLLVLIFFTHERYLPLFGLPLLYYFVGIFSSQNNSGISKENSIKSFILCLTVMFFVLLIYKTNVGARAFDGTGGTNLIETFSLSRIVNYILLGYVNILGVSVGENYLYGLSFFESNIYIQILSLFVFLFVLMSSLIIAYKSYCAGKRVFLNYIIIQVFIFLSLFAGCITIRLEMRWLYTPFIVLLYSYIWAFGALSDNLDMKSFLKPVYILILCAIIVNLYYRSYWKNIYFYNHQVFYNEFNHVVEKYYDDIYVRSTPVVLIEKEEGYLHTSDYMLFLKLKSPFLKDLEQVYLLNSVDEITQDIWIRNPIILVSRQVVDMGNQGSRSLLDLTHFFSENKSY